MHCDHTVELDRATVAPSPKAVKQGCKFSWGRAQFGQALRNWVESAMDPAFDDQTQVTLTRLFELSVIAYDEA